MMRFVSTVTGAGLFCAIFLMSCGKKDAAKTGAQREAPPRQVRVAHAAYHPMERVLQVVGTLAAREEATIGAQVAGQLEKIYVDIGDRVKAGQELAQIDTTSYEALANASAANLARANASAANAAQELKRVQGLQRENIASISDLDTAIAEAARTSAEVKAAEANHAIAQLNLNRSRVRAPFDGAIAVRLASAGNYLAVGTPIMRLVQTDPLRLRLDVPERESIPVRVGQAVRVSVEGDTNLYRGQIARVAPAIREDNRMLQVEADIPNRGTLRAGLFVRATIIVNEEEPTLSVPANSLITFAGLEKVVVVENGKAAEKTVTTGRREGGWVEIISGVNAQDTVVLEPAGIRTGQPLSVSTLAPAQTSVAR
jgi:HlyD family secretion protein